MEVIARAGVVREIGKLLRCGDGDGVTGILVEGDAAQQRGPIELDHFRGGLRPSNRRSGRDGQIVTVGAFQVESETGLRIGQQICTAHGDVGKVRRIASGQSREQGLVRSQIHAAKAIVGQALGEAAALVGIEGLVAVVRVRNQRLIQFRLRDALAEVERSLSASRITQRADLGLCG